jgi:type IV secretion system protein VirB10
MATVAGANEEAQPHDIRPVVGRISGNGPLWIGLGLIAFLGAMLFFVLDTGRRAREAPAVRADRDEIALAPARFPPTLALPPDIAPEPPVVLRPLSSPPAPRPSPLRGTSSARDSSGSRTVPSPPSSYLAPTPVLLDAKSSAPSFSVGSDVTSAIIVDGGIAETPSSKDATSTTAASGQTAVSGPNGTAVATRPPTMRSFERGMVVQQGTLIGAVLETALDSTQPGQARALISSDIKARRGGRILIPRGSRLFGSYQGELAAGQNRVMVQWNRLVRPDGVTVAIDSPATDRLGRAGIKGNLNTYFLQRLGGALLQSAIDIATISAARGSYDSPVLIAVPGRLSGVASDLVGPPPKPSISVRAGTRISVFVVRDLDFSEVEARR